MKAIWNTLVAWGPLGAFVAAVIDGAGLPSPGGMDWFLVLLCVKRPDVAYWIALCAVAGSLIGSFILFSIARRAGEKMLDQYRGRARFDRFEQWFQRYGLITVFIPALVPIPMPMKFFVICAGVFHVRPVVFLAVMAAARVPRFMGLAYLGARLGENSWPWLKAHGWHLAGVALALFVFLYLLVLAAGYRRNRS